MSELRRKELIVQEYKRILEAMESGRFSIHDAIETLAYVLADQIIEAEVNQKLGEELAGYRFVDALLNDDNVAWSDKYKIFESLNKSERGEDIVIKAIKAGKSAIAKKNRASRPSDAVKHKDKQLIKEKFFDLRRKEGKFPSIAKLARIMLEQGNCELLTCNADSIGKWARNEDWRGEYATTQLVKP